jgi:hypothetical protein
MTEESAHAVEVPSDTAEQARCERLLALASKYAGMYGPGDLDDLCEGWDE